MRLIDRDALLNCENGIRRVADLIEGEVFGMIYPAISLMDVMAAHIIDAVPVVHARWLYDRPQHYKCSACKSMWGELMKRVAHFCPNCGAKMDG